MGRLLYSHGCGLVGRIHPTALSIPSGLRARRRRAVARRCARDEQCHRHGRRQSRHRTPENAERHTRQTGHPEYWRLRDKDELFLNLQPDFHTRYLEGLRHDDAEARHNYSYTDGKEKDDITCPTRTGSLIHH